MSNPADPKTEESNELTSDELDAVAGGADLNSNGVNPIVILRDRSLGNGLVRPSSDALAAALSQLDTTVTFTGGK